MTDIEKLKVNTDADHHDATDKDHVISSAEFLLPNPHSPEIANAAFLLPDAPPQHPDTVNASNTQQESTIDGIDNSALSQEDSKDSHGVKTTSGTASTQNGRKLRGKRKDDTTAGKSATRFFSAYAETWIGLSPLWLMGEAITPGKKVGTRFFKGKDKLFTAAFDLQKALGDSGKDVIVIVDEKLRSVNVKSATSAGVSARGKEQVGKTVEVIKAAGEHALLIVTTSLEKIQADLTSSKSTLAPQIKSSINKNGRDVILIMDKALKNPIVVTGVNGFARSKGIPHADALLRLASLGLSRILRAMPPESDCAGVEQVDNVNLAGNDGDKPKERGRSKSKAKTKTKTNEEKENKKNVNPESGDPYDEYVIIEEMTADELERSSTHEEGVEADEVEMSGKGVEKPEVVQGSSGAVPMEGHDNGKKEDPYEKMRKRTQCPVQ